MHDVAACNQHGYHQLPLAWPTIPAAGLQRSSTALSKKVSTTFSIAVVGNPDNTCSYG
jgi:hypothetical protein